MNLRFPFRLACLAAASALPAFAEDPKVEYKPMSAVLSHEFGSIVSGIAEAETLSGAWIQRTGAWLNFEATMDERLTVRASLGGMFWYSLPEYQKVVDAQTRYFSPNLGTAHAVYRFGEPTQPSSELTVGFFSEKYNPDARNLGEYLFRSGAYPGYISTGGLVITKTARTNLLGAKWQAKWPASLSHEFVLNSSTELFPLYDLSFAYLTGFKTGNGVLDLGGGVQLDHYLPVKPSRTSPKNPANGIFASGGKKYVGSPSYYEAHKDTVSRNLVRAAIDDTANPPAYEYISFKAVKLMARGTLDPKPLFPSDALGKEDLKVYAEMAVLGVKNYDVYYEKIAERMPVMVGINLPAFKLLDVLSVEVEKYASPHANSYEEVKQQNLPIPYAGSRLAADPKEDDLKWSIYTEKQVLNGVSVVGQVARDHLRAIQYPGKTDPFEAIRAKKDWHWTLRLILKI